ncbi:MAG TPA: hypothetical protein VIO83_09470 [Pseudomonas sp.]
MSAPTITTTEPVHISEIRAGDTVSHNGCLRTVGRSDIKRGGFMGTTLFGDSYRLGHTLVERVTFNRPTAIAADSEGGAA